MLEESSTDALDRQVNRWVLEQSKPETSLEAKVTELTYPASGTWEMSGFLGKDNHAGTNRRKQKKRGPKRTWIGSKKEAIGTRPQELSRTVED